MKLNNKNTMYFKSMNKLLKVTALFTSENDCNDWLKKNRDHGVIGEIHLDSATLIVVANMYDKGTKIAR